jgi:3-hydroxyacyl-[acyl-carrier-protein] dehydratase
MEHARLIAVAPPEPKIAGSYIRSMMPHRGRMMLLDRVESFSLAEPAVVALKNVCQNDPLLEGHFRDVPVFPPALVIEAMAQSAGFLMNVRWLLERDGGDVAELLRRQERGARRPPITVLAESRVRHSRLVYPGSQLVLEARGQLRRASMQSFSVRASVDGREVASGSVLLAFPDYVPWQAAAAAGAGATNAPEEDR